jgi:crotonobetaine/carnitine-CoA ligase
MRFKTGEKNVIGLQLKLQAKSKGDKPFVHFEGQTISYRQMNERTNRVANGLAALGVKQKENVVIYMDNCPEFLYTWFALSKLGAVEVPINTAHKGNVLEYFINYSDARTIVVGANLLPNMIAIMEKLKFLRKIIVFGDITNNKFGNLEVIRFNDLLKNPDIEPQVDVRYRDLMAILFTSGTTGTSKGVMLTHNQACFVASRIQQALYPGKRLRDLDKEVLYVWAPLSHVSSQFSGVVNCLLMGATMVLTREFSAKNFWQDIEKYKCTVSGVFEAVMNILSLAPATDKDADNTLRALTTSHVPAEIHEPFEKRFGLKLINIFGSTEADATVIATYNDIKIGSFGKPRGYFEARIVDSEDRDVPIGKTGELVLRPRQPHIMFEGYYKMPEKTLEVFRNLWWHTGDLVYRDKDGYFFFVGREKDMIRRGGENISALEVERVLMSYPGIRECAAVATPSATYGEEVKVVIVTEEGKKIDLSDLVKFCDDRMAYFMVPRYYEFVKSIPRTDASQRPIKSMIKDINENTLDRIKLGIKIKREMEKGR